MTRGPLFAPWCGVSAAIAYQFGWRVVPDHQWMMIGRAEHLADLMIFFASGGELDMAADRQRFRVRRILADMQRTMKRFLET